MTIKRTVGILGKNEMAHTDDSCIESLRDLGTQLQGGNVLVLASFSGGVQYVKEALLTSGGALLSLSPACSEEEHTTVFRHTTLPEEKILYTGLGRQLTIATLLRSVDMVIAIDEGAYNEAKLLAGEEETKKVFTWNEKTKNILSDFLKSG